MEDEVEIKWEKQPPEIQVQLKITKARQAGYNEFLNLFQKVNNQDDKLFDTLLDSFDGKNFINDPIEVSRDKASDVILLFIEKASAAIVLKSLTLVMPGLVLNCLTGKTRVKAFNIALKYIKIDKKYLTLDELSKVFKHKNPKIGQASLELLKTSISQFDIDYDKINSILKANMDLFESRDKSIRDEFKLIFSESFKKYGSKVIDELKISLKNIMSDHKKIDTLLQEIESVSKATQQPIAEKILPIVPATSSQVTSNEPALQPATVASGVKSFFLPIEISPISSPLKIEPLTETIQIVKPIERKTSDSETTENKILIEPKKEIPQIAKDDIDEAVIECIAKDGRFLSAGTLLLLKKILPNYQPPSKKTINKQLEQKKQLNDNDLKAQLENTSDIALSTELFKNSRNSYFLCLRAHFFDKKFLYKTVVLSFKRFIQSEHISVKINSFIKYELNRLDITTKIRSITTDSSDNIIKATSNNQFGTRISCLINNLNATVVNILSIDSADERNECDKDFKDESHYYESTDEYDEQEDDTESILNQTDVFNDSSDESLLLEPSEEQDESDQSIPLEPSEEQDESDHSNFHVKTSTKTLNNLMHKIRKIIRLTKRVKPLGDHIKKEAKKENLQFKLILDMNLRWHSTYLMIDRYLKHSKIIEDITIKRPFSISVQTFEKLKSLKLSIKDLILLKSLAEVLEHFYEQSLILESANFLPLSYSQDVISNLRKFLTDKSFNHNNSQCVNDVKDLFHKVFSFYFEKSVNSKEKNLRLMATYLNPMHFKHLNQKEKIEIEKLLESLDISLFNAAVLVMNNNKGETPDLVNDMLSKMRKSNQNNKHDGYKLTIKEELVYYVVRIKQNNLLSNDESVHKSNLVQFWNQEKETLTHLFALFNQVCCSPCTSSAGKSSFNLDGYIQRKCSSSLYSDKLCCSKVLEEFL